MTDTETKHLFARYEKTVARLRELLRKSPPLEWTEMKALVAELEEVAGQMKAERRASESKG